MKSNPNPKIRGVLIGKNEIREVKILPLSISDQFKLSDLLSEGIAYAMTAAERNDETAFVVFLVSLIRNNLDRIMEMVTGEPQRRGLSRKWINLKRLFHMKRGITLFIDEMTNDQAWEVTEAIYQMNYESIVKKTQPLIKEKRLPEPLSKLFQFFSGPTLSTDSKTSTEENPGEKED